MSEKAGFDKLVLASGEELDPEVVGCEAAALLQRVEACGELYKRLRTSSIFYNHCWVTDSGLLLIDQWDVEQDSPHVFEEAMRALALKAAVWRLTEDESLAELLVAAPVDEMVHAVIAQPNVWVEIMNQTGFRFIHMTDLEKEGYAPGCFTHQAYLAAWGVEPNSRYWLDAETVRSRRQQVDGMLSGVGIHELGRRSSFRFAAVAS